MVAFSKALAREVARNGVTVNCVCPAASVSRWFDHL